MARQAESAYEDRNWMWWLALSAYFAAASAITLRWAPWGDEEHFLYAVRLFGQGVNLDLLRSYPETATPLAFITYAFWGRLVGFDTWQLRLLSPLLAVGTCALLAAALSRQGASRRMVFIGTAIIATNPYFLGLSVFVFTDMLSFLMLMIAVAGVRSDRAWVTGVGIAGAVLTRQYLAFLTPAVIGSVLLSHGPSGLWRSRHAAAACLALLPLAWLVWLWGGMLAPASEVRDLYLTGVGLRYDIHALSLYLAAPGFYLAPLLLWRAREGISGRSLALGLTLALVTLAAPIQPVPVQIDEGILTVGFAHRLLSSLLPAPAVNVAWFLCAALWLTVMIECARDLWVRTARQRIDAATWFPWGGIVGFLLLMPFSYLLWEKYAVPLFILSVLILCAPAKSRCLGATATVSR